MMRRLARVALGLLIAALTFSGAYAVDARHDHDAAATTITEVRTGPGVASYEPGTWTSTVFVLLIGSDERAGLDGARGDALHVVGLNPSAQGATIIDIPRDTWVDIPGHGPGRINTAYQFGGAELQAEVVRRLTGASISYVITTTFAGLTKMVDDLGGIDVDVPYPMSDPNSGAFFNAGVQHLGGAQVLAFSRNRHIPDGDLVRTAHQGQVIIHALSDLRAKGTSGSEIIRSLDVLYRNVRTIGIRPTDLFRLGRAALSIEPGHVRNYAMPATIGFEGKASVVFVEHRVADGLFADFADDGILQQH